MKKEREEKEKREKEKKKREEEELKRERDLLEQRKKEAKRKEKEAEDELRKKEEELKREAQKIENEQRERERKKEEEEERRRKAKEKKMAEYKLPEPSIPEHELSNHQKADLNKLKAFVFKGGLDKALGKAVNWQGGYKELSALMSYLGTAQEAMDYLSEHKDHAHTNSVIDFLAHLDHDCVVAAKQALIDFPLISRELLDALDDQALREIVWLGHGLGGTVDRIEALGGVEQQFETLKDLMTALGSIEFQDGLREDLGILIAALEESDCLEEVEVNEEQLDGLITLCGGDAQKAANLITHATERGEYYANFEEFLIHEEKVVKEKHLLGRLIEGSDKHKLDDLHHPRAILREIYGGVDYALTALQEHIDDGQTFQSLEHMLTAAQDESVDLQPLYTYLESSECTVFQETEDHISEDSLVIFVEMTGSVEEAINYIKTLGEEKVQFKDFAEFVEVIQKNAEAG